MNYQLYHGDCLEVMPTLESGSVDTIIADLPYGITACKWDSIIPLEPLWAEYKRLIKPRGAVVLFGSQPFTSALVMSNLEWFKYTWVWHKTMPTNFLNANNKPLTGFEDIIIFSPGTTANGSSKKMTYNPQMTTGKSYAREYKHDRRVGAFDSGTRAPMFGIITYSDKYPTGIIKFSNYNGNSLHPTQKPVELLEYLVRTYTNPGDLVLDNVFGSCTTGVACLNTGRLFIGIEKDANYFKIGKERMDRRADELRGEYVQPKATEPIDTLPLFQEQPQ